VLFVLWYFIHFVSVEVLALVTVTKNQQTVGRHEVYCKEYRQLHVSAILIAVTLLYGRK